MVGKGAAGKAPKRLAGLGNLSPCSRIGEAGAAAGRCQGCDREDRGYVVKLKGWEGGR